MKISEFFNKHSINTSSKLVMWICDDVKNSSIKTSEGRDFLSTGREICDILNISFDSIENIRSADQTDNINYFLEEVEKIKNILNKEKERS